MVGSRSNFWRAAVDDRGSALPSTARSNKSHYQFQVVVCVSVISGHMRPIGVLIFIQVNGVRFKHKATTFRCGQCIKG